MDNRCCLLLPLRQKATSRIFFSHAAFLSLTLSWSSRPELWPKQLHVYLTRQSCRLSDIQAFVRSHATPLCMLMPDRSASGPEAIGNEASFRALSRLMMDNQAVSLLVDSKIPMLNNPVRSVLPHGVTSRALWVRV